MLQEQKKPAARVGKPVNKRKFAYLDKFENYVLVNDAKVLRVQKDIKFLTKIMAILTVAITALAIAFVLK